MDIRTTYLIMAVVFFAASLGVYYASKPQKDRELVLWCVGWIFVGLGFLLVALRGSIPYVVSLYFAHLFLGASYVLRTVSIKAELCSDKHSFHRALQFHGAFGLLYFIVYCALVLTEAPEHIRLMYVYLAHIVMFGELAWIGLRIRRELNIQGALLVAAMGLLMGIGCAIHVVMNVLWPENMTVFSSSADKLTFLMLLLVGFIFGNYGFVQIRLEKSWRKNQIVNEELSSAQTINQQLERVLREKNELLRSISLTTTAANGGVMMSALAHELSQPLNSMRLNVDYLKRHMQGTNEKNATAQAISDVLIDTERLVEIVAKIRQMFQRNRQTFDRIDPNTPLEAALRELHDELIAAKVHVSTSLQRDLWIWGEPTQLTMLFINLLRNAKEALLDLPVDRHIGIGCTAEQGQVRLTITDNGRGVPQDRHASLFDLYTTSKESGLGVGLWICRMVAEHHRGSIQYSNAPGGGAQFTVSLPAL